jgi:hypothetical protein
MRERLNQSLAIDPFDPLSFVFLPFFPDNLAIDQQRLTP